MCSGVYVYVCILEQVNIFVCVCGEKGNSVCWYVFICLYVGL